MARSSFHYRPRDRAIIVDDVLAQRVKHLMMQLKGWQCHRRLKKRCSPRVEGSPSVALVSNVR